MAITHSLTHSLTHSIFINLFIKLRLNIFLYLPCWVSLLSPRYSAHISDRFLGVLERRKFDLFAHGVNVGIVEDQKQGENDFSFYP